MNENHIVNTPSINLRQPLSMDEAQKIQKSFMRLRELKASKIITKESEAEQRMIQDFLNKSAIQHLNELMGCWFVVMNEYQPLIGALMPLMGHALRGMMPAQPQPEQEAKQVSEKPVAENAVPQAV